MQGFSKKRAACQILPTCSLLLESSRSLFLLDSPSLVPQATFAPSANDTNILIAAMTQGSGKYGSGYMCTIVCLDITLGEGVGDINIATPLAFYYHQICMMPLLDALRGLTHLARFRHVLQNEQYCYLSHVQFPCGSSMRFALMLARGEISAAPAGDAFFPALDAYLPCHFVI